MKILIKNELDRAFKNKWFYITLIVCLAIIIYDMCSVVIPTRNALDTYVEAGGYPIPNIYNRWMELNNLSVASKLLHFIFPLLVCIPYSMSIYTDVESGYIYNIILRIEKKKYFLAKLITQFITGFAVVMSVMTVSFILTSMLLPEGNPMPGLLYHYGALNIFGRIFYKCPLLTVFLMILLESVLFGLISCLSYTFAYILKNGVMVLISAFTIYFFEEVVLPLLGINGSMMGCSFIYDLTYKNVGTLVIEIIILIAVIAGTYMLRIKKKDEI